METSYKSIDLTKSVLIDVLNRFLEGKVSKEYVIEYASRWWDTDEFGECDAPTNEAVTHLENWDDLGGNFSNADIQYIRDSLIAGKEITSNNFHR